MLSFKQKEILKKQIQYNILNHSNLSDLNIIQKKCQFKNHSIEVIKMLQNSPQFIYPIKSYCIAIVYSLLLEQHFKISFYDSINNCNLLLLDQYFISYAKNKKVYKNVIRYFGKNNILNINSLTISIITEYFNKEFLNS